MKFVVQEHFASHHHFDFRLEMDEMAKSWAIPKNMPEGKEKRLAIQVEDHTVEYMDFEGEIPEGMYGAGKVSIWDKGEYELIKKEEKEIEVQLSGQKLKGKYVLIKFPKGGKNAWLIQKI
ncbi:MAG: DNA polymerase ligase N-terminal domain-containing protein [Candidatus Thermoplasmatota archaeon]|nr:DNA polymerase ligase N-terminal domain-containing protein [Candidatus Thermoplasmatota archaeon]